MQIRTDPNESVYRARVRLVVVGSSRRWVVGARVWAGGAGWGLVSECIHTYMQLGNPPKSPSKCTFNTTPPCQRGVNVGLKKFLTEGRRASRTVPFYGLSAKKLALGKLRPLFLFGHLVGKFHPRRTTTTAAKVAARRTKRRL